ncbi:MAG: TonB-dependent receptor plug domain-containing protein [Chitinophagaceae bacterium]|jgi:TonB-dependent SusC/RagA subfamily outer membrane receptor
MKALITTVFALVALNGFSQTAERPRDNYILELLEKYFREIISSSSMATPQTGVSSPLLYGNRTFLIKNDTLFIYTHDPKDILTQAPLNDTNTIAIRELEKVNVVYGKSQTGAPGVGMEFVKKRSLGDPVRSNNKDVSSSTTIDDKKLSQIRSANVSQRIAGQAPGVMVSSDNNPGAVSRIRIRGLGSINSSSNPLYILDDVPISNINMINPDDLASVTVLKDAAATAIYGIRGANGVIVMKSKKGGEENEALEKLTNGQDLSFILWTFGPKAKEMRKAKDHIRLSDLFLARNINN